MTTKTSKQQYRHLQFSASFFLVLMIGMLALILQWPAQQILIRNHWEIFLGARWEHQLMYLSVVFLFSAITLLMIACVISRRVRAWVDKDLKVPAQ